MQRDGSLSKFLTAILIPVCTWGLICSLVLHLIELRSLFVQGGEWRLRLATLAFAAGVVLLQRLTATQGKSVAHGYAIALGVAITLFALHNALAYRLPAHPGLVFLFNEICFLILWWVGYKTTSAYAKHFDEAEDAAAEYGLLARRRQRAREVKKELTDEEREALWRERLKGRHPGLVLLYFSLFAIPAFGLGVYLFEAGDPAVQLRLVRLGVLLFVYLWCAFCLLFLSSLSRLRAYFEKREVTLPEMVGLWWLVIGFLVSTSALVVAAFLPQPPSVPGSFVRNRMVSVYRGWESRFGVKDTVSRSGAGSAQGRGGGGSRDVKYWNGKAVGKALESRYSEIDKLGDKYLSEAQRNTGFEPEYRNMITLAASVNESFQDVFDWILKAIAIIVLICAAVVILVLLVTFWRGLSEGVGGLRRLRSAAKSRRQKKKKKPGELEALKGRKFLDYANPFLGARGQRTGDALVRYLWEAMLAFCGDFGTPCTADQTPLEYVSTSPAALDGFEDSARFIAETLTYSEFSGQPVPDTTIPALRKFWEDLNKHVNQSL